ncbi:MAG: exopolysaccharide biosynthesis polyprenyl glycosylphosphotransferase [Planctomycetota bacterium]
MIDPPSSGTTPSRPTGEHPSLVSSPHTKSPSAHFRRVSLDRLEQHAIMTPTFDGRRIRQALAAVLLACDLTAIIAGLLLAPTWVSAEHIAPIAWAAITLTTLPLLGLMLVSAYSWDAVARIDSLIAITLAAFAGALAGLFAYKLFLVESGAVIAAVITWRSAAAAAAFAGWAVLTRLIARRTIRSWRRGWSTIVVGSESYHQRVATTLRAAKVGDTLELVDSDAAGAARALEMLLPGRLRCIVLDRGRDSLSVSLRLALVHARLSGVRIVSLADVIEEFEERVPVTAVDSWWILDLERLPASASGPYLAIKRLIDLAVCVPALALLLPVLLLTAIAVRVTSRGPILFTQIREGLHRTPFLIFKFRTMRVDAEVGGAQWATKSDPRVTSIGAFLRRSRLDELPQLLNVILGDMSLVGPRPERPEFNHLLAERIPWYDLRHVAQPGITGWAQVRYPYGASVEDAVVKLEYDAYYVKHASLIFDLRILAATFAVVFGLRGR